MVKKEKVDFFQAKYFFSRFLKKKNQNFQKFFDDQNGGWEAPLAFQRSQFWMVFGQNGENDQKSAWNIFPNFLIPNFI